MPHIAILAGERTPFCKAGGVLKGVPADDLGTIVLKEVLARLPIDPGDIDEVVFGNVAQPTDAANVARVIALRAGIPKQVTAHTVHRNCASGMQAITTAATEIVAGQADLVVAGGTESMSGIPLLYGPEMTDLFLRLAMARSLRQRIRALMRFRPRHLSPIIALKLGLTDPVCGLNMGQTAEVLARRFGITRADQDAFALESHRRASAAMESGRFDLETVPVIVPPKYATVVHGDDGPRRQQSMTALAKLRPYFDRHAGTVTVGNACPVTDGAAALVLASASKARELGIEPLGWLRGWTYAGLDNDAMGLGPAYATSRLLARTGLTMSDFDVVELNEAFAAQVIANQRAFESDSFAREELGRSRALGALGADRLNPNGGAIALGHPVGATGARLVLTTLRELEHRDGNLGLATLCVSGGQGAALALERAA